MEKTRPKKNNPKAFSLLEMLVSVALIALIMTVVSAIFASSIRGYRNGREMQRNLENAQFALNLIAKTLRTTSIVSTTGGESQKLRGFDYSQDSCVEFNLPVGAASGEVKLSREVRPAGQSDELNWCKLYTFTPADTEVLFKSSKVEGRFSKHTHESVGPDTTGGGGNPQVGKATFYLFVCEEDCDPGTSDIGVVRLQTTVSLRDYQLSEL